MLKNLWILLPQTKNFKVKSMYKYGLSDNTKNLMKKRDSARNSFSKADVKEKPILQEQYRKLRNLVNFRVRKVNVERNEERIIDANNEQTYQNLVI